MHSEYNDQIIMTALQKNQICDTLRDLVPFVQYKNVKNTHGGMLLLACNFTESNTLTL